MKTRVINFLIMIICLAINVNAQSTIHSDVKTFDLKGKVKKCTYTQCSTPPGETICSFSLSGKYEPSSIVGKTKIDRDEKGRIIMIKNMTSDGEGGVVESLTYNEKGLVSEVYVMVITQKVPLIETLYKYTYNASNRISKCEKNSMNNLTDKVETSTYLYSYTKIDEKGNWTERTVTNDGKKEIERRSLVYY